MMPLFQRLLARGGWQAGLCLLVLGALVPLSLAPVFFWPVLFVSFPALLLALHGADTAWCAAVRGWWWGMGVCLAGFYWIVIALTVDMARFGWMIPFALLGLNGALALFWGMLGALYYHARRTDPLAGWLLFILLYGAIEWLRGHIFTGFPWNLAGYAWGASDISAQAASLFGVYGLTWLTVALVSLPFLWWVGHRAKFKATLVVGLFCAALLGWGQMRLLHHPPENTGKVVRLVQAAIPQTLKWQPDFAQQALVLHESLSVLPAQLDKEPDMIVWPESAFPFGLDETSGWPQHVGQWLAPGQVLVSGAVMRSGGGQNPLHIYNGMAVIDSAGRITAHYYKHHLVPFGEYLPLRTVLPDSVGKLTAGNTDFSSGKRHNETVLLADGLKALPLICYEIIFPSLSFQRGSADMILNITNDAWYGNSSGPYQHLQAARFRAIEQGIPVVRVAGSGVSAVFDGLGRVQGHLPLGKKAVLDVVLPAPLLQRTFYQRIFAE